MYLEVLVEIQMAKKIYGLPCLLKKILHSEGRNQFLKSCQYATFTGCTLSNNHPYNIKKRAFFSCLRVVQQPTSLNNSRFCRKRFGYLSYITKRVLQLKQCSCFTSTGVAVTQCPPCKCDVPKKQMIINSLLKCCIENPIANF